MGMGVRQLLIFFHFMVKQVALVALGTWALMFLATVLYRWILLAFTFAISFRYVRFWPWLHTIFSLIF